MGEDFTRVPRGPSHGGDIEAQVRALNDHAHDVVKSWRVLNNLIATIRTTANGLTHNAISGLQGGRTGEYYHLTAAQLAQIVALAATYQPLDSDLTAIAALTTTAYGRAFLALADSAAARTATGTVIGTNVQAYDAFLTSIAGLGTAADKMIYTTAADTAAETAITSAGRALIDDATAAAQRTTLGFSSKYHYVYVPFIAAANTASATLTTHPSTAQFFCNNNRNITKFDTTHFTDVRMLARVTTGSASANTPRLRARYYKAAFSTTISDYSNIGSSEVSCSLTSTGLIDSGWISIVGAASAADVYLTVDQIGGDSAASPAVGQLQIVFRGVNTEV